MRILVCLLALGLTATLRAEDAAAVMEKQVADLAAGPQVTVVHFWAPWCPNCAAEMTPAGWAKFIAANPAVKFVFLNVWSKGQDPAPKLAAAGLGAQPNLLLLTHPNSSRKKEDRLTGFLGLPLTWLPSTWVFKEGKLYYALNYGEVRFEVLQRCVNDSLDKWEH
ncbi:MAG: TlpA family protein disulfide reductase [Opitutales bacterium]